MSWVMPSDRRAASSASGVRRFQSAGSSSQLRVEVEGARDVALRVLLGDPEVHVEEEEPALGRGLGPLAGEDLRAASRCGRACRSSGSRSIGQVSSAAQAGEARVVDADVSRCPARARPAATASASSADRRRRRRPARRRRPSRRGCRWISASSTLVSQAVGNATAPGMWPPRASPLEPPAVVGGQRPDVDDREVRVARVDRAVRRSRSSDSSALRPRGGWSCAVCLVW